MYYIIGLFRSTSLYSLIIFVVGLFANKNSNLALTIGSIYPISVLVHQLILKIKNKSNYSFFESFFSSFFKDLLAPFRHTFMFFLVITKKHIIRDKNKFYNALDLLEVIAGFICTISLIVIAIIAFC